MTVHNISLINRTTRLLGSCLAFLLVSACAEDEVVLPGEREQVSAILAGADTTAEAENETRSIRLPAARVNDAWPQSIGTPRYRTDNPVLGTTLARIWSADIGAGDSRRQRITAAPVVANGLVYTLDADATVTATSRSGQRLWQTDIRPARDDDGEATGGGLAYDSGRIYAAVGYGQLVALDARTGGEIWRQKLEGTASGTPTVFDGLIYLTAGDDRGWAISADDGLVQWQLLASPDVNNVLGAPAPAVGNDLAVFAFGSGEVQAVFRQGGLRRWDAAITGQRVGTSLGSVDDVTAAPVISGNRVYVGNQSGRLVALNLDSGARLWTADEGAVGNIVVAGGSLFVITDLNRLMRIDAANGRTIWNVPLPRFTKDRPSRRAETYAHHGPLLAGGLIRVASNDGLLRSFDPTNGALVSSVEVPGGATSSPVVAGGVLYVVSSNGQLHAFR